MKKFIKDLYQYDYPGTKSQKNEDVDKESQEDEAIMRKLEDEDMKNLANQVKM